jgi:putative thioredoxin
MLEKLTNEQQGAVILAKVNVDQSQELAQVFQIESIPAVKAVKDGQLVLEFTGALPEAQVRAWLAALVPAGPPAPAEADVPDDPDAPTLDQAAVDALLDTIRASTGAERDEAREALLALLAECRPDDPAVLAARRALANALY